MTTITSFVERLAKKGIKVELIGNWPWVYLDKVNGIKVKGTHKADHGFTVFMRTIRKDGNDVMSDTKIVFDKIRETLQTSTLT